MKPRRGLHLGLLFLALINMYPAAEAEDSWGLLAIAVSAAVLSCLLSRPSGGTPIPRWIIHLFILASTIHLLYEMFAPHEEPTVYVLDLAHFMMLLCSCKFFELRTTRDTRLVILISFLLLVISAFVSAGLLFGIVVAIDVTFGVGWMTVLHVRRETDLLLLRRRALLDLLGPGTASRESRRNNWSAWEYLRTTAAHSLGLVVVAIVVFVAVPRGWGQGLFGGIRRVVPASVTGFSDVIQLQDATIFEDHAPVMRVRFTQNGEVSAREDFQPYMRGLSFDRYYKGQWHRTGTVSPRTHPAGTNYQPRPITAAKDAVPDHQIIEQEVWLERTDGGRLFAVYPPLAFGSTDIKRVEQDRKDFALQTREQHRGRVRYTVQSAVELTPEAARILDNERPRPGRHRRGSQDADSGRRRLSPGGRILSEIPPRVADFARRLGSQFGDPTRIEHHGRIVHGICDYLQSGEFEYTLKRGPSADEADPVADFLLVNKRGHCEYFASAMTLLCQALGIPARLVNGYYGGELNSAGGFYQFRQKDAHAWAEVHLSNRGWAAFDPSPPSESRRRILDAGLLAELRRLVDFVHFKWSTLVVSFDASSRQELVERFRTWFQKLDQGDQMGTSFWATVKALLWGPELLPLWQRVFYWLLLGLCTALVLLVLRVLCILSLMLREYVSVRGRDRADIVRPADAKFYDRLLLLLASKGHVKPSSATPREFAAALARSHADLAELPGFTDWFYRVQYGGRRLGRQRREQLRTFLRQLREDPAFGAR